MNKKQSKGNAAEIASYLGAAILYGIVFAPWFAVAVAVVYLLIH